MRRGIVAYTMVALFSAAAFAQQITSPPPGAKGASTAAQFAALIEHSRHTATLRNGRLVGGGRDFLHPLFEGSQFVLLGEQHGNSGIAQFAESLWRELSHFGFKYFALEVDPWIADAMERELRSGGIAQWTQFLDQNGGPVAVPFYSWQSEAELAHTVVRHSSASATPTLWGLDQVFIGAAPWLLRKIAEGAHSDEARSLSLNMAAKAEGNLQWLGQVDVSVLAKMRGHLDYPADEEYARLIDAMIRSNRIYGPFVGAGGEATLANADRELLIKQTFVSYYERALRADPEPPKVMFKFGASHMFRGASGTMVQGAGGFVSEFAIAHNAEALTILLLCAHGGEASRLLSEPTSCDDDVYARDWKFLMPHIHTTDITLFDLRIWRLRQTLWSNLPAATQRTIASYDVLAIIPGYPASRFLPGLKAPKPPS